MIIVIVNSDGGIEYRSFESVRQGSVEANKIMLVCPFSSAAITVAATLPNGLSYGYDLVDPTTMTKVGDLDGVKLNGEVLYAYTYTFKGALTASAGTLTLAFYIRNAGATIPTSPIIVNVERTTTVLPETPTMPDDIYNQILDAVSDLTDAVDEAKEESKDASDAAKEANALLHGLYDKIIYPLETEPITATELKNMLESEELSGNIFINLDNMGVFGFDEITTITINGNINSLTFSYGTILKNIAFKSEFGHYIKGVTQEHLTKGVSIDGCSYIENCYVDKISNCEMVKSCEASSYENCTFVDPYTCKGFVTENDVGKVAALTDDGSFNPISVYDKNEVDTKVSALSSNISSVSDSLDAVDDRLQAVEIFFKTAEGERLDTALDTLVEIQDYINNDGEAAAALTEQVNTNTSIIASNTADIAELKEDVEIITHDLSDANERLRKVEETVEEGGSGVSSWNDLTDKPFGSETVEGIITFDGDYSKYEYIDAGDSMYVRVSDKVLTADDVTGATIRVVEPSTDKFEDITADSLMSFDEIAAQTGVNVYGCAITLVSSIENGAQGIYSIGGDISALQALGLPFTKEGTYFVFSSSDNDDYYVESISCLTGSVEIVKQIDKKYLPNTSEWNLVITAEMLKESSLNDLLAGANGRVFVKAVDDSTTINVPAGVKYIEFAPGVIFGSIVEIIGSDDFDTYYLDDCQVIKGATVRVDRSDTSHGALPTIRKFKGGVEHCHGTGWYIKDCNNVEHCTYLKIENCYNISHCNIGKGCDEYGRGTVSVINCSNIEDLITTDETMDGWEFENCQFIRDIKASHSLKFTSCDHISNVVSTYTNATRFTNCKFIRNIQASDCNFENCEHISNVAHNPSPSFGAQYKNCKYVDAYTCVDFLSLEDIGKVQALTDDGTFSAVAI